MTQLFSGNIYTFGSGSALHAIVSYEKRRNGADMQYQFYYKIFVSDRKGNLNTYGYYQNPLKATFTLNGTNVWEKQVQGNQGWSFEYTSEWFTVKNKTSGTTPFKFTIKDTQNSSWCNYTSGTFSLGVEPAGSDIGAVANFNIGNAITVPITKYASMYDVLVVKIGSTTIKTMNNVNNPATVTFTSNELNTIYGLTTTVQSTVFTFELTTYEDSSKATVVGVPKTTTARGYIVGSYPLINSITMVDINPQTSALTENSSTSLTMIRYKSNVKVSVSASGVNKATIKSVTINGKTAILSNGYYVATFNSSSTNSFKVEVIDSRKFPTPDEKTMPMVSYVDLTLNANVYRNQPTDGKLVIDYSGNYFNGSFGNTNNSLTVQYRYIQKGGSLDNATWNTLTPTISGNTYKGKLTIEGFDYQKQYVFQVRATDKLGTPTPTEVNVTKGEPILYWNEDFVGVNGDFEVKDEKSIKSGKTFYTEDREKFQTNVFGVNDDGFKFKTLRSGITGNSYFPQYSSGFAWASHDTHGILFADYRANTPQFIVGGGNGDKINWIKKVAFEDDISTLQTNINNLQETVLYNSSTGTTGNVTLGQSSANFTYLEIFFKDNNSNYGSVKVYSPNGKNVKLFLGEHYVSNSTNHKQFMFRKVSISGTSISNVEAGFMLVVGNAITTNDATNYIYITRVVGYK